MKPEFRFRVNGVVMPELRIQRGLVNGDGVGDLQIVVKDDSIGWITLDDNSHLPDKDLSRFTLEYRDETAWALIPPYEKRLSRDKGWKTATPKEVIEVLVEAGVIDIR